MSKSTNGLRKAGLASLAVTLTLGAGIAGAGAANAITEFDFQRIGGADRYETSALVAEEFGTYDEAILANGEPGNYVDALAANYLAGEKDAPILLTRKDETPQTVLDELEDEGVTNLTVVGGETVISAEQVDALEADGFNVTRVSGDDRFATNVEILEAGGAGNDTAIVATGFDFADALAGGPAVYKGAPVGLTSKDDIDDDVVAALKAAGATKAVVLGGTNVVDQAVLDELEDKGITPTRIAGSGRSETSTAFADYAIANLGFSDTGANIATGYTESYGADALAGGPLTGQQNRPMLITRDVDTVDNLVAWLNDNNENLTEGIIFGGTAAVDAAAEAALEDAASTEGQATATTRPELQTAQIVETVTPTQATASKPAGTYVRYTFDEQVLSRNATTDFKVYRANGSSLTSDVANVEAGGMSVLARFNTLDNDPATDATASPSSLTVATVVAGAVIDSQGQTSPAGDAPIGTAVAPGGGNTLPAGVTAAPDLLSVGNFREATAGGTTVDFTFDEAAYTTDVNGAGFSLIPVNGGTPVTGNGPDAGDTTPANGTVAGGNGTTTLRVYFASGQLAWADSPSASQFARGAVAQGAVRDTAAVTGNENPGQTADMSNGGNTTDPDLVSVTFRPGATNAGADIDQVVYTFDQTVSAVPGALADFVVYDVDGDETAASGAQPGTNFSGQQVVVNFANNALVGAVGASVAPAAVQGPTAGQANEFDEVGAAGTAGSTAGQTPGSTAGPDLTGVAIGQAPEDIFGQPGNTTITFTFDEDVVTTGNTGAFTAYLANGTAITLTGGTRGATEATDNTVTFTAADSATSAQWQQVVLGTVATDAVEGQTDADNTTGNLVGDNNGESNPEGAEVTTGGSGTPAS